MPLKTLSFDLDRDDLCDRLGGGLPAGTLIVVEGAQGAGKSILTQRLAYGLIQNEHSVSYVSSELTTTGFLAQMESLKYDVEQALMDERLVFIPVYPLLGNRAPRHDLLRRIVKTRAMYSKDLVVFDSFSKFLADHARAFGDGFKSLDQVESVLYHFKRLASMGKTIILTFEKGQVSEEMAAPFKDAADVLLNLQFELIGNSANRRVVVQRMARAAGRFGEIIGYRVEPGVGIVIEIKSVV
jgi:archaeal flagellar protein FlaH